MPNVRVDERQIDKVFAHVDQSQLPGAAVGVALQGRPIYRKGFGLCSIELPTVLSPTVRMRIGSATKQFTSLAYLLLCEHGKAALDDLLSKYLPEVNTAADRVTMRQLMSHTSGLRDAMDLKMQFSGIGGAWISSEDFLGFYGDIADLNADPGSLWVYNNGAYILLGLAIERISGLTLEEFFRSRIFEPIGMHDTLLRRRDNDFVPNSATSHMTGRGGHFERGYYNHDLAGAGAIVSTVDDMLRWLAHMESPIVGNAATWRVIKGPAVLSNGSSTGYGLGLNHGRCRGLSTLEHAGGWTGASAQVLKIPALGLDVAIMLNREDIAAATLAHQVIDACVSGLDPVEETPSGEVHGVFQSPVSGRVVRLFATDGKQFASINGRDLPVTRDGNVLVPMMGGGRQWTMTLPDSVLQPISIQFSDFGNPDECVAVEPVQDKGTRSILGCYKSHATGIEVIIHEHADGVRLRSRGRFGSAPEFDMQCLAKNIWQAKTRGPRWYGGALLFDSDHARFRFSNFMTRSLTFQRCS